ncbi:C39 family peptidase [Roseimicrobium sp. ORNL1]|uniref:C39 family peptidase n=1 Tax=Roseimicrobium sp. ORNL1 TaxID=2711231 RepID=UPI0013E18239|nr:C39 family peptidase [Roseimicrobium sp. ORNL1]QIF04359.1 hypothetical protein G5S37_23480 [Roseimicrobium sp. ORNL1]
MLRHLLPLLLVCGVVQLAAPALSAQSESGKVQVNLDPLLTFPGLWDKTQETVGTAFVDAGVKQSPEFYWIGRTKGAKDVAVFDAKPYADSGAHLSLFAGKVPVDYAGVYFTGGKVNQLIVQVTQETPDFEKLLASVQSALDTLFAATPTAQAQLRGFEGEKGMRTMVWRNANAMGVLSVSKNKKLMRISFAPASADPILVAGYPVQKLMTEDPKFFLNLDSLLALPALWSLTPERVEKLFATPGGDESPYYQWLTSDKTGVRFSRHPFSNVEVDLSLFDGAVPVEEAVVEFTKGKASRVSVSLYNRGDSGSVQAEEFKRRYQTAGVSMGKILGVRPTERRPSAQSAVKIGGWAWNAPSALAALEYNAGALEGGQPEFLRLRLAAPGEREAFASETGQSMRRTALGKAELPRFVKREKNGDVFIGEVPMVDQGAKGYCVVASCQRLFSYLRIPCDQHEIAQIAGSDAGSGTNSMDMEDALRKIDSRFKVNFKALGYRLSRGGYGVPYGNRMTEVPFAKFEKQIEDYTSKGIPMLWALELGRYPEEPANAAQAGGGHMRLIIGYNQAKQQVIFTDSWGAGHELKRMSLSDAFNATLAMYVIEPKEH